MCNRLDTVPYKSDFSLVRYLDHDHIRGELYQLSAEQFREIVKNFQYQTEKREHVDGRLQIRQLAMNVLSIHMAQGLYVLAYRKLNLDVKQRALKPDNEITICTEFTIDGTKQSIRRFLDGDEYELLADFEANQERIKDCIAKRMKQGGSNVDDMPYIIGFEADIALDLHKEYQAIMRMYQQGEVPVPIRAFFNERTVLFASYNNHPINGVYEKLSAIKYHGRNIPFPVLRLGNNKKVKEALITMKRLYEEVKNIKVFERTLDRNKGDRKKRAKRLSEMLKRYEDLLDLKERKETIDRVLEYGEKRGVSFEMMSFEEDLRVRQQGQINRKIEAAGEVSEDAAVSLLNRDIETLKEYLYYTSAGYIKKIGAPRNEELKEILEMGEGEKQLNPVILMDEITNENVKNTTYNCFVWKIHMPEGIIISKKF